MTSPTPRDGVEREAVRVRARSAAASLRELLDTAGLEDFLATTPTTVQERVVEERMSMTGLSDGAVLAEALGRLRQVALAAATGKVGSEA